MADHARYSLGIDDEYRHDDDEAEQSPLELEEEASPVAPASSRQQGERKEADHARSHSNNGDAVERTHISVQPSSSSSSSIASPSSTAVDRIVLPSHIHRATSEGNPEEDLALDPDSSDALPEHVLSPRASALADLSLSLSHQRGLFDLRGIHVVVAACLLGLTVANWICYGISNSSNNCRILVVFVLLMSLVSTLSLLLHPILLVLSRKDPEFLEAETAKWMKRVGLAVFVGMLSFSIICLSSISSGACHNSITLRQIVIADAVLLCCMWMLGVSYAVLRWRFPTWRLETAKLWSRHVKLGLLLLSFGLLAANLTSLIVNGRGAISFHIALTWTQCPEVMTQEQAHAIPPPQQHAIYTQCQNQHGLDVDASYCEGVKEGWKDGKRPEWPALDCPLLVNATHYSHSSPTPDQPRPPPLAPIQPIWSWALPTSEGPCDEEEEVDAQEHEEPPESFCFSLVTRQKVDDAYCVALPNPSSSFPSILVPPRPCVDCEELYWYDLVYACVFAVVFSVILADIIVGTDLDSELAASSTVPAGIPQHLIVENIPPLQASVLAKVLRKYPRVAGGAFVAVLVGLFIYSLVSSTYYLSARCSNYLLVSVANTMLTLNGTVAVAVFLVRNRQQVWNMDPQQNPFERVGLL
jgi:hypothetical protein